MAEGDIGAVIDTLEFDATFGNYPSMVHVSGDVYAIAYLDTNSDGKVASVSIDSVGEIGNTVIDTLVFYTGTMAHCDMMHISGDVYAVSYTGTGADGFVCTFAIDSDGEIGAAIIDSQLVNSVACTGPKIIHVYGTVYAIVYSGLNDDGYITTVTISDAGAVTDPVIETHEFMTTDCVTPDIIHVSGSIFAIAYKGTDHDGYVSTMNISSTGDIAASPIETLEFDEATCFFPEIINVAGDTFAVAYQGPTNYGTITTFTISSAGDIAAAIKDTFQFDTGAGYLVSIVAVSGKFFAIAYQGPLSDGWLCTLSIDNDGTINDATLESSEFEGTFCEYPTIIHVSGDIYAIAYHNDDDKGILITANIETVGAATSHILMMGI